MERKDKQTISKLKLIAIREQARQIRAKQEKIEELRMSLYGTGIDYSKDNVQTSPVNTMELYEAEIDYLTREVNAMKQSLINKAKKLQVMSNKERFILINKYFNDMSINQISRKMKKSKRTVNYIHSDALENYYDIVIDLHSQKE